MFKKKIISSLILATISTSAFAANCQINQFQAGWSPTVTFSCDSETNLTQNNITFDINDATNVSSVWGLPASATATTQGNTVTIKVGQSWSGTGDVMIQKNQSMSFSFSGQPTTQVSNFKVGNGDTPTPQSSAVISVQLPSKPENVDTQLATVNITRDGTIIHTINNQPWGSTTEVPVTFSGASATYSVQVASIKTLEGKASPAQFTLSNGSRQNVNITYSGEIESKGSLSIMASVSGNTPQAQPKYVILDTNGTEIAHGELSFSHATTINDLNAQTSGTNYILKMLDFVDHQVTYHADPDQVQVTIKPNQTTQQVINYTAEAPQMATVTIQTQGLELVDGQKPTLTLKHVNGDGKLTQSIVLNQASQTVTLPKDSQRWEASVTGINDIQATVTPQSFISDQNDITLNVAFAKKPQVSFIYSPYKDTSLFQWNKNDGVLYTLTSAPNNWEAIPMLGSNTQPPVLLSGNQYLSIGFVNNTCQDDYWGPKGGGSSFSGQKFIENTLPLLNKNNIGYIISTGGAGGAFMCDSVEGMKGFIDRYSGPNFVGLDLDIEVYPYNQQNIRQLMQVTSAVQKENGMRVSITVGSEGAGSGVLHTLGDIAVREAIDAGLDFSVNLMVMNFSSGKCQMGSGGQCDMAASSIYAAEQVSREYNIPLSRIELTPMIGTNDVTTQFTSLDDMQRITNYAINNGLAGVHMWSFDRDRPCGYVSQWADATCSGNEAVGVQGYNKSVLELLNLPTYPRTLP